MNQKEAVIEALKKLGGRAHLSDIYKFAYPLADWSGSQNWQNTLRWYLQKNADTFRSPKRGWWELVSYQEELATLKKENEELKKRNNILIAIPNLHISYSLKRKRLWLLRESVVRLFRFLDILAMQKAFSSVSCAPFFHSQALPSVKFGTTCQTVGGHTSHDRRIIP